MGTFLSSIAEKAGRSIKNWWLYLLSGILCVVAGVFVFCNPRSSFIAMSSLIGVVFLVSGVVDLVVAVTSRNYFMTRSYNVLGGILDILVGLLLCANPMFNALALPIIAGIWLMYHSFMIIGIAGDFKSLNVKGASWGIVAGILLLILSFFIVFKPFSFGAGVITTLMGIAFLLFGLVLIVGSLRLRKVHNTVKDIFEGKVDY